MAGKVLFKDGTRYKVFNSDGMFIVINGFVQKWFHEHSVEVLQDPAQSPDLRHVNK